jgi:hypothetical protein
MQHLFACARQNSESNPWVIAMTVMLATFMEVLDISVANVAFPHIARPSRRIKTSAQDCT